MSPALPPELWELVLAHGGALALARWVRASARRAGAMRIQRAWRARVPVRRWVRGGDLVLVRVPRARAWRPARAVCLGEAAVWAIEVGRRGHLHFLPASEAAPCGLWIVRPRVRARARPALVPNAALADGWARWARASSWRSWPRGASSSC